MKNHIVTQGIVLTRTDFQEADRILTILTPDHGKVRVIAKGVRRAKSKLAGGIELLSVSDLTLLPSRGELQTLASSRLITHYGTIVKDIKRTMLAYDFMKRVNRVTEDAAEAGYFALLQGVLAGLDDPELDMQAIELWFTMQLLDLSGHAPDLLHDTESQRLLATERYVFEFDAMAFREQPTGPYGVNHIKLLRLAHGCSDPIVMKQVNDAEDFLPDCLNLAKNILRLHILR